MITDLRTGKAFTPTPTATRRDFGKGLAAILAAGCAPSVVAAGLRHGLGARTAAWSTGGVSFPYVTNGLLGLWCPKLKISGYSLPDLSGYGNDMTFVGVVTFGSDNLFIDGKNRTLTYGVVDSIAFGPCCTEEIVCNVSSSSSYGRLFAENKGLCFYTYGQTIGAANYCYGFGLDGIIGGASAKVQTPCDEWDSHSLSYDTSSNKLTYFKNGVEAASTTRSWRGTYTGTLTTFNRTSGDRGVSGYFGCMRIYDHALTADEIEQNKMADVSLFGIPS